MAARSKKNQKEHQMSLFKREALAIVCLGISIFLYLSLLSYHPSDPSFMSLTTGHVVQNWGGVVGAYLADLLLFIFGAGAYFIGLFFFLASAFLITGLEDRLSFKTIPVSFSFVVFVSVLFQLSMGSMHFDGIKMEAGGFFGEIIGGASESFLGLSGAYLLVIFGCLITFAFSTRLSVKDLGVTGFGKITQALDWLKSKVIIYSVRLRKMVGRSLHYMNTTTYKFFERLREKRKEKPKPVPVVRAQKPDLSSKVIKKKIVEEVFKRIPQISEGSNEPHICERVDSKKKQISPQLELENMSKGYQLPPLNLLDTEDQEEYVVDEDSLKMNARILEKKLADFNVEGQVTEIHPGPVITMYEFQPAPGVKLSKISNLVDDLCLAMGGRSVRIVAPLPNKPAVGIEIPNTTRETVWFKDVIADEKFQKSESRLVFGVGKDIEGLCYVADLAKMPHLLVAGATGSGKSVSINAMIMSILYKAKPEEVRMLMIDPKMLELSIYEGIPHLLLPVVTQPKKASITLKWAVKEMERRYKLLSDINARNIKDYNKRIESGKYVSKQEKRQKERGIDLLNDDEQIKHECKLPYIVIVVDELADLMMVAGREIEESITRLAQMARAAGLHLIIATQRPSVDVITGIIKANFPARMAFKVSSKHDARTVLDTIGAERLLGNGDMLFIPPGTSRMIRVHGAYLTDESVSRVVEFLKKQAKPVYDESILQAQEASDEVGGVEQDEEVDELYDKAVALVAEARQASISMVQRKLRVGYNRAARMIEKMEEDGIVSPASGAGHRQVLVSSFEGPG